MRFNTPRIFPKMPPWHTKSTPWTNLTHWSLYRPLWCIWLLKLLLWHRWVLNWPLEMWLRVLWSNLLQRYRTLQLRPLWPWPNMLRYELLLLHPTNIWNHLYLALHITVLPLLSITPISVPVFIKTFKLLITFIIPISLNSRRLPKWKSRVLETRLI
ncbi:hypothetical protein HanIR_Chr17g0895941 [Helianthus annuus]|nr:hypothetical protein HanIR_Chr17g0895941 [Helianthus annuus]